MFKIIRKKKSFMESEILASPKIIEGLLENYIGEDNKINLDTPQKVNRINIIASGSSYNCARYAAGIIENICKIEAKAIYSSEFLLKEVVSCEDDILYVFITQSGETSDTNNALEKVNSLGVNTLCITNRENSPIWINSKYHVACLAGEERSIAATKSLTSQLFCSILLALKLAHDKGIDINSYIEELKTIPEFIRNVFEIRGKIKQVAKFLSKFKSISFTADGESYALAREAALKIKETSFIFTNSTILGEFMHGHLAVLNNPKSALVYILNDDFSYPAIKNLDKIKTNYNPMVCIIGNRTNQVKYSYNLNIDCSSKLVKTFCLLIIIQLLSLEIALRLNKNVDKPKGLNKVVQ